MIERIHMQILRAVRKKGTLTEAAQDLNLTQPALSHSMKKLEGHLGVPLWIKDGRRLRLTKEGEYLLTLADRLLPQLEHAEEMLQQFARGKRGSLRVGMECHPCYRWLLKIVSPFLQAWPDVDVDVKQEFQFGGTEALADYEIDLLITPDPPQRENLVFTPVFDYELVLAVSEAHPLGGKDFLEPRDLMDQELITYPVGIERLDLYTQFLLPAGNLPPKRKIIETTDIMLQMVASGRGVTALPYWLIREYKDELSLQVIRIGPEGIHKQISIGTRQSDRAIEYIQGFMAIAEEAKPAHHGGGP